MVKIPKSRRTHCPYCRKHTVHEIEQVKKRKASELKWGQRQFRRVMSGYGGFPRALPSGEKPTKKISIRYRCKDCGKAHTREGFRTKRLEFVD